MKINGNPLVSVTATVQKVAIEFNVGYTLINEGAGLIAYRHDSGKATLVGASEAALRALGGAIVYAGESVFVEYAPYVEVACITGATATLRIEPGDMVSTIASSGGGVPGAVAPVFLEKSDNAAARVDGTSVGGEALATATPYTRATVTARKAVTDTDKASIANVGTVWICGAAEDIDGAFPLLPGQSMGLPDNCSLGDFFLAVDNLGDGVAISYTV
jgi:hypothetical protein